MSSRVGRAEICAARGDVIEAVRLLDEQLAIARTLDAPELVVRCLRARAELLLHRERRPAAALTLLREARALADAHDLHFLLDAIDALIDAAEAA